MQFVALKTALFLLVFVFVFAFLFFFFAAAGFVVMLLAAHDNDGGGSFGKTGPVQLASPRRRRACCLYRRRLDSEDVPKEKKEMPKEGGCARWLFGVRGEGARGGRLDGQGHAAAVCSRGPAGVFPVVLSTFC